MSRWFKILIFFLLLKTFLCIRPVKFCGHFLNWSWLGPEFLKKTVLIFKCFINKLLTNWNVYPRQYKKWDPDPHPFVLDPPHCLPYVFQRRNLFPRRIILSYYRYPWSSCFQNLLPGWILDSYSISETCYLDGQLHLKRVIWMVSYFWNLLPGWIAISETCYLDG